MYATTHFTCFRVSGSSSDTHASNPQPSVPSPLQDKIMAIIHSFYNRLPSRRSILKAVFVKSELRGFLARFTQQRTAVYRLSLV